MAAETSTNSLNDARESLEALLQSICGLKFYTDTKAFAKRHPFIFAAIFSICLFSLIPLMFFLGFAIVTLFIALICFLCIEGSIIAIGGIIFIGVVGFISVIVVALLSAVAATYFILQQIRVLLRSSALLCFNSRTRTEYVEDKTD